MTAYEQTFESNLQKVELLVNEEDHWKKLKVFPDYAEEVTEEDDAENEDSNEDNLVETLKDGGAFMEPENVRYNLRRGAKKHEGFYRE